MDSFQTYKKTKAHFFLHLYEELQMAPPKLETQIYFFLLS